MDGHNSPVYAGMIYSVDESVGRVIKTLQELGLEDNTLVIFTSDNGGVGGYEKWGIQGGSITDNAPLHGGKGMLYEGGVRVPYVFRWPGKIKPGTVCNEPINSVDLYPTLLEVAGAQRPDNYVLDGLSYWKLLTGDGSGSLGRDALFWHFPGYLGAGGGTWRTTPAASIRMGDWKLIEFFETGKLELYNLKDDIGETKDLSAQMPDKVKELHDRMLQWRQEVGAKLPTKNTDQKPADTGTKKKKKKKKAAEE